VMMSTSVLIVALFIADSWVMPSVMAFILMPVALYIVTRASYPPSVVALKSKGVT
jgi:hypothetical protein